MIRVILFLVIVGLLALGVNWLADRPGDVAVTWVGWRIETSMMVALAALGIVVAAAIFFWSILRAVVRSPHEVRMFWQRRRSNQGYLAISRGLIAIGAGDAGAARKHAAEARRLAPDEPLALLLGAQTAQISGDRDTAERSFRAMAERADTRLIGLRGLFVEAQRHNDIDAARLYAEEAANTAPALPWAGQAVMQFRCATGDWDGALEMLTRSRKSGALSRDAYQRQRAVLLTAQALALQDSDRDRSRAAALEAVRLAPDLIPAVALAAHVLAESEELRKAARMVEKAWRAHPHPDLAAAYANLRFGDSALDRLARMQSLAAKAPGHIEGALAVARAAVAAREFRIAREALAPFVAQPTQRVALMMADIEEADRADEGRAREWTSRAVIARRDPTWTADGFISDRWMPMSPVSGRLDAFEWKVPLAEIERAEPAARNETAASAADPVEAERVAIEIRAEPVPPPVPEQDLRPALPETPVAENPPVKARTKSHPRIVEPIVPLVHVPDDPGPEPEAESEPVPGLVQAGRRGLLD